MPDYSKSIIYTIKTGDRVYVGSTINFSNRKYDHKSNIYNENRKHYNIKLYKTIRENGGEWDMKPYKQFPCENITQLTIEEERVRVEMNADLNSYSCHGFDPDYNKKYQEENKEQIKEQRKQYRLNNKEEISERKKKKTICECGCEVGLYGLPRHKKSSKHIKLMGSKMGK